MIWVVVPPKDNVPSSTSMPPELYVVHFKTSFPEPFFVTFPSDSSIRVFQVIVLDCESIVIPPVPTSISAFFPSVL